MKNTIAAAVVLLVASAAVYAQTVTVDSDPAAPFASCRTYAWVDGTPAFDSLNEERIHSGVDARLAARGLAMNTTTPDVIVATHVTTNERKELVVNGFSPGPWSGSGTAQVETYIDGTLIVDLYDAKTKKMVWRGVATAIASDKPSKNASKINKALDKMFERFPIPAQATH